MSSIYYVVKLMKLQVSYIDKLRARGRPAIYGPSFFAMFLHSIILELRTHIKIPNVYSIISSCYRGYLTDLFIFKYFKRIFNVHHFSLIILSKCDPKGSSHKFLSCAILNFFSPMILVFIICLNFVMCI